MELGTKSMPCYRLLGFTFKNAFTLYGGGGGGRSSKLLILFELATCLYETARHLTEDL